MSVRVKLKCVTVIALNFKSKEENSLQIALMSFARKVVVINPVEWVSHIEERSAIGDVQAGGVVK